MSEPMRRGGRRARRFGNVESISQAGAGDRRPVGPAGKADRHVDRSQTGRDLRDPRAAARAGVHRRRDPDAGARHRRQHRDLQRHQHGAAAAAAVRRRRPAGVRLERRTTGRPTISVPAACSICSGRPRASAASPASRTFPTRSPAPATPRRSPASSVSSSLLRRARRAAAPRRAVSHRRRGSVGGRAVARAVEAPLRRGSVDRRPHDHAERTSARWSWRSCARTSSGRRSPRGRARRRARAVGAGRPRRHSAHRPIDEDRDMTGNRNAGYLRAVARLEARRHGGAGARRDRGASAIASRASIPATAAAARRCGRSASSSSVRSNGRCSSSRASSRSCWRSPAPTSPACCSAAAPRAAAISRCAARSARRAPASSASCSPSPRCCRWPAPLGRPGARLVGHRGARARSRRPTSSAISRCISTSACSRSRCAVSVVCGLAFGAVPALQLSRDALAGALGEGGTRSSGTRRAGRTRDVARRHRDRRRRRPARRLGALRPQLPAA